MFMTKLEYQTLVTHVVKETSGNSHEFFKMFSRSLQLKINEYFRKNIVTDDVTTRKDLVGRCVNGDLLALRFFWYMGPSLSVCIFNDPYDVDVTSEEIYGHKDVISTDVRIGNNYDTRVDETYKILMKFIQYLAGYECPCQTAIPQKELVRTCACVLNS